LFFLFSLLALAFAAEDPDVVVLTADNFDEVIKSDFVLVEFYAPWCGHCKKLTPEYQSAAQKLKESGSSVTLAKVDATIESALGERFAVRGYPTLKFFRSGEPIDYDGGRTANEIVNWVTKKSGPASKTLASQADIDGVTGGSGTRVIAYTSDNEEAWLNTARSDKLQAFAFSHITDSSLFGDKKEGTVEIHKDGEEVKVYDGAFNANDLTAWVLAEGFPLVDDLSQESWTRAQVAGLDLVAVFHKKDDKDTANAALEVAKAHKGAILVTSTEQIGIASRWGASGNVMPTVIYVNNGAASPSFVIWNEEKNEALTADSLSAFVTGAKDGSYESYVKSEPIPEKNDAPVTILVGKNFDEIVNQKRDVLVEFYAPWCGHCQKLTPIYDELGAAYKEDDGVIIAKMDATANGVPKGVNVQGFPTIIFFDADGKQVSYEGERELESFKSFIDSKRVTKVGGEKEKIDL